MRMMYSHLKLTLDVDDSRRSVPKMKIDVWCAERWCLAFAGKASLWPLLFARRRLTAPTSMQTDFRSSSPDEIWCCLATTFFFPHEFLTNCEDTDATTGNQRIHRAGFMLAGGAICVTLLQLSGDNLLQFLSLPRTDIGYLIILSHSTISILYWCACLSCFL